MSERLDLRLVKRVKRCASAASLFSVAVGLSGLTGWMLQVRSLTTWGFAAATMVANTAACFVLCGISLWLQRTKGRGPVARAGGVTAKAAAAVAGLTGLLSLAENGFGAQLGIDQWLVAAPAAMRTATVRPGLMSPVTAGAFVLLSLALLGIDWRTRRGHWPAQFLAIAAGAGAMFGILAFAFDPSIYGAHLSVALPTGITLTALSVALACARPERGLGALLCSRSLGGSLTRSLLPAALIPILVGGVRWRASAAGHYSEWSVVVLASSLTTILLACLIAWAARAVERSDRERRKIEEALEASPEQLGRILGQFKETEGEAGLRRKAAIGFMAALLLTVSIGVSSWHNTQQAERDADWVSHTHEVMETIQRTTRHVIEACFSARAFSLTGSEPLLGHYQAALDGVQVDQAGLRRLTADNSSQQRRLDGLGPEVEAALELAASVIAKRRQLGAYPGAGEDAMEAERRVERVRATAREMYEEETRLLVQRTQRAQGGRRFTRIIAIIGALLGVVLWVLARAVVSREIRGGAQAQAQVVAMNADLERRVERRTAELHESEGRLSGIVQSAMDAIITVDDGQRIVVFNTAAEKMFRCSAPVALGQLVTRFIPQRYGAAHGAHVEKFGQTGSPGRAMGALEKLWAVRDDGEEFQIEASISHMLAGGKQLFTVILRDITERVQAEAMREHLAAVVESSEDAIVSKDMNGIITAWNRGAEKIFGYRAAEALGQPMLMLFPPERRSEEPAILERLRRGESVEHFETVRVKKDGLQIDVSAAMSPIRERGGAIVGASSIMRDISEHKRAEERLAEQAKVLDLAQVLIRNIEGRIVQWSAGAERLYGFSREEAVGRVSHELLHTEFPQPLEQIEGHLAETGSWQGELLHHRRDGSRLAVASVWILHRDAGGNPLRVLEANTDITERNRAQERLAEVAEEVSRQARMLEKSQHELEEQSRMLMLVLENMGEGLIAADQDGHFLIWNDAAKLLMGRGAVDLPSERWTEHYKVFLADGITPYPTEELPLVRALRGESVEVQLIVERGDAGQRTWLEVVARPLKGARGELRGGVAVLRDVTVRKLREEELRESEERFRLFIEYAPAALAMFDREMRYLHVSQRWRTDYRLGPDDLRGVSHYQLFPETPERWKQIHRRGLAGEVILGEEDRFDLTDGSVQWIRWEVRPWRGPTGKIAGIVIFAEEITSRKRAEDALRESEERFRAMVNGIPQLAWMAEADGNIFWYNQRWFDYTGTTLEQMKGWEWQSVHDPAILPLVMKRWTGSIASGEPFDMEFPLRGGDGKYRMFLNRVMPVKDLEGRVTRWVGTNTDISEREEAGRALRDSESFLQSTLDALTSHIAILDEKGEVVAVNAAWRRFFAENGGIGDGGGVHSNYLEVCRRGSPEAVDAGPVAEGIRGLISGAIDHFSLGYSCDTPTERRWFMMRATSFGGKGEGGRVVVAHQDVSAARLAEERLGVQAEELSRQTIELLRSQAAMEAESRMLQLVLQSMGEGLVAADTAGRFLIWNEAASKLLGRPPAEIPEEQWAAHYQLFLPDGITPYPADQTPLSRALRGESLQAELRVRPPDASTRVWLEATAHPMKDAGGKLCGGVVAFRDISQRKAAEKKIEEMNQDLEARVIARTAELEYANRELESFTYSVSHDLRAPLRHIAGFSRILADDFGAELSVEARRHLRRIEEGVRNMGQLVDELLNLARVGRHELRLQPTALLEVVEATISMLQPETQGRKVVWKVGELPVAECDAVLVKQVFQNLIANALKFTRPRECAVIEIDCRSKDGQTVIAVRDNGVGFDMKYKDKLFGVFQRLHRAEDFEGTGASFFFTLAEAAEGDGLESPALSKGAEA
jgi:PAS domain S-box-containing protein